MTDYGGVGQTSRPRVTGVVRTEWTELGPLGRTALVAVVLAAVVAVALAISIPRLAMRYLLEAERDSLVRAVDDLIDSGVIQSGPDGLDPAMLASDMAIRLPGREVVRVKVWTPDGEVVYSDAGVLVGNTYPLSQAVTVAFEGRAQFSNPNLAQPENVAERGLGPLTEFYIPVHDPEGNHVLVYELYERSGPLLHTVNDIRRYVFISVGVGVGLLGILVAILIIRHGVHTMRRQRQTERLLGDLIRIQDEERSRIIGSLHDDVGQPLYRILFGLEECRGRVGPESQVAAELLHIEELARSVDSHLRSELRLLDAGITGELDLVSGLRALAAVTEAEAGIPVDLETIGSVALPPVYRSALLRAAHEGVINVRKHAFANEVKITVSQRGDMVWLEVADDGVGLTGGKGLGIVTTTERLEAIGGGLKVTRRRSGGTLFQAWVPAIQPGGQE